MIVQASNPQSYAEMVQAYKARQARYAAAARKVHQEQARPVSSPVVISDRFKPLWMFGHCTFTHHIDLYRAWKREQELVGGHRLKRYIRDRAVEHGLSYAAIVGISRKKNIVAVRQLIIWEIKSQVKPEISFPELGRLFGGRDHTTCLHAVRKIEEIKARGE